MSWSSHGRVCTSPPRGRRLEPPELQEQWLSVGCQEMAEPDDGICCTSGVMLKLNLVGRPSPSSDFGLDDVIFFQTACILTYDIRQGNSCQLESGRDATTITQHCGALEIDQSRLRRLPVKMAQTAVSLNALRDNFFSGKHCYRHSGGACSKQKNEGLGCR
jgi:hypothetical protein